MNRTLPSLFSLNYAVLAACIFAAGVLTTRADVTLPSLISDHAVLQRSEKTHIWGKASPGEKVSVALGSIKAETVADTEGKWFVDLNLDNIGQGPYELTVTGKNILTVKDIVIGEVWVASGQSNMAFQLYRCIGAKEEMAHSSNPMLRHFLMPVKYVQEPQESCRGEWKVASPETAGYFTAVGYYFGKKINETLNAPVGLLHSSLGGTPAESWTSLDALKQQPTLAESIDQISKDVADFPRKKLEYIAANQEWEKKTHRENFSANPAPFIAPNADTSDWVKVKIPGKLKDAGLPDSGIIWLRRSFTTKKASSPSMLAGNPIGFETIYLNGEKIKESKADNFDATGDISINPTFVNEGGNVITIRLYNVKGGAGILTGSGCKFNDVDLSGEWLAKAEQTFPALTKNELTAYPQPPKKLMRECDRPAHLYNGMIEPLISYTIQGAIWYQGEANAIRAFQYKTTFPAMIQNWRKKWNSDFPFYFCQLANYGSKSKFAINDSWAELRESQTQALSLPKTGQAVLIDTGEADDIHPRNKKDAGERLALVALAKTYGKNLVYSGPAFDSYKIEDNKIRISFKQPSNGLIAKPLGANYSVKSLTNAEKPLDRNSPNSELEGFAICGEDRRWVWADAKIDGDTVLVWSSTVTKPIAVRYGWSQNPTVNLYNKADLPAGPFRTDNFPWSTEAIKYQ
jgi:sialate O-acetylesterase